MSRALGRDGYYHGGFVLSLDLELFWGVKGTHTLNSYAKNILGVREVVPRLLDLFERHRIGCTWAVVGLLCFEDRAAMMAALPARRPVYDDPAQSSYAYLEEVGPDEAADRLHFGLSLVRQIAARPRQEIGTHTFSHYYCLEGPFDAAAFAADLDAAIRVGQRLGRVPRSIVFPRNQVIPEALEVCRRKEIDVYRGQAPHWYDRPMARRSEGPGRRACRLAGSLLPLHRPGTAEVRQSDGLWDVPASRFLRPLGKGPAGWLQEAAILREMRAAAAAGSLYHLWFHPHNFGADVDGNVAMLDRLLAEAAALGERHGWPSLTMEEAAGRAGAEAPRTAAQ